MVLVKKSQQETLGLILSGKHEAAWSLGCVGAHVSTSSLLGSRGIHSFGPASITTYADSNLTKWLLSVIILYYGPRHATSCIMFYLVQKSIQPPPAYKRHASWNWSTRFSSADPWTDTGLAICTTASTLPTAQPTPSDDLRHGTIPLTVCLSPLSMRPVVFVHVCVFQHPHFTVWAASQNANWTVLTR